MGSISGVGAAVSCLNCHFDGPPFGIHPGAWVNVVVDHQGFPNDFSWTRCANAACHGTNLRGRSVSAATGPSCFSASFTNDASLTSGCHSAGPPSAHRTAASFEFHFLPATGLPQAKNNMIFCQNCHGRPLNTFDGGYVSDPQVLALLDNQGNGNCSAALCHPAATAHPTDWAGLTSIALAGNIVTTCVVCHNLTIDTTPGNRTRGPFPGAPSCFSPDFTNANNITSACHAGGPSAAPHELGVTWLLPSGHVAGARTDSAFCLGCHSAAGRNIRPFCSDCHRAGDPLTVINCASCHGNRPDGGVGAGYPNRIGRHGIHILFECVTCHFGSGDR